MGDHPLEIARRLDELGFNVLPARRGGKAPVVPWQKYQNERTTKQLKTWFGGGRPTNFWINTGSISGVLVLDIDSPEAEEYWRKRLPDELSETASVKTAKGHHYYFRIPDDRTIVSWSHHEDGVEFDVRAEGTGVIVPPSQHESGHVYEWVQPPEAMLVAPKALFGAEKTSTDDSGGKARSQLADLLSRPPEAGDRNNWLTRVAGHYAKHFYPVEDLYRVQVRLANEMLSEPLPEEEVLKTMESIWNKEWQKRGGEREGSITQPSEANGWLLSGGDQIFTLITPRNGEPVPLQWADFDIRALGVVEDDEAERVFDVEVNRSRGRGKRRALLPARKLADPRALATWLAELGVGILPVPGDPRRGIAERLRLYVENQEAPHFRVVDSLGWHRDGFITHEGIIRASGSHGFEKVKPNPRLRNWAPYRYGFVDEAEAREVLNEVLTFHDETVCSVFGAWWAACFLKPQVHEATSMFPFLALQAPSESGKTTGFFPLMMQLAGNTRGQTDQTKAALRDSLSAHQSGIVWIDDLSDTSYVMDLLRQATGEGAVTKKGEDRAEQVNVQLVAPIMVSGEALQMHHQKALIDRAVMLEVPSPIGRRSLRNPERRQWEDIVELRRKYSDDLTQMAGTIVQLALQHADLVRTIRDLVPESGGRFGDKIAVVRMGAHLLGEMTGDESHIRRVDEWADVQEDLGSENTLTTKLIPMALRQTGWRDRVERPEGRWPATPVVVDRNGTVWFHCENLAAWWEEMRHGRVEQRTESAEAIRDQARALGLGGEPNDRGASRQGFRKRFKVGGDPNRKVWYWSLPDDLSAIVTGRSRGEPVSGVHPQQKRLELEAFWDPEGR